MEEISTDQNNVTVSLQEETKENIEMKDEWMK